MKPPKPFEILKDIQVPILIALVSFAGAIFGSLIGPYLTAKHQITKDVTDRRVAVYNKFFAAQAKLLQVRSGKLTIDEEDKLTREYQQETKEARFEIGVFGSPEVIQALVNWFRIIDNTDRKDADLWKADVKIYQAMRKEIFGNKSGQIKDRELYYLLFGYWPIEERK